MYTEILFWVSPNDFSVLDHLLTNQAYSTGLCLLLTIPVLGLTAHWTQGSSLDHKILGFEGMGLFISIFSFIVLPIM